MRRQGACGSGRKGKKRQRSRTEIIPNPLCSHEIFWSVVMDVVWYGLGSESKRCQARNQSILQPARLLPSSSSLRLDLVLISISRLPGAACTDGWSMLSVRNQPWQVAHRKCLASHWIENPNDLPTRTCHVGPIRLSSRVLMKQAILSSS